MATTNKHWWPGLAAAATAEARKQHAIVTCKFCDGKGKVSDVSKWPPVAPCPGCRGAGVHRV